MSPLPRSKTSSRAITTAVAGLATAACAGAIVTWLLLPDRSAGATGTVVTFVLFVLLGDLLEIPLERRAPFSLALAPAIGFGLLRTCPASASVDCPDLATPHIGVVVFVFLLGATAATLFRAVRGRDRDIRLMRLAKGALVVAAGAGVYRLVLWAAPTALSFGPPRISVFGLGSVLVAVVVCDVIIDTVLEIAVDPRPFTRTLRDRSRATVPLLVSSVSVGALLALAYPVIGAWTFPLFLAPLSATQFSFSQVARIRRNYLQTIRALSKVPEMAGYTVKGHSSRVARLSVDIGTELGVGDTELHEIEYAALLHDIGRVSVADPEDTSRSPSGLELALVGAEIVENTGHFPAVAEMVRQQHEPYRRRGEDANRALPNGAKIIRVASAFDDLTEPGAPGRTAWDALEKMHLGMAYDYDPQVIQALTRVLERRGLI